MHFLEIGLAVRHVVSWQEIAMKV